MYKILKVLNNSGVLVMNLDTKQEVIFIGKGIGCGRKINENVSEFKDSKAYFFERENSRGNSIQMIKSLDGVYIEIAGGIIEEAEKVFDSVDNNILIPLADHIAFAVKRINENMEIRNPFSRELRVLFEKEYCVALKGREIIKSKLGIDISDDKVGYITLHVHSAVTSSDITEGMDTALVVKDSMDMLEKLIGKKLHVESLSYARLVTHLKYMLARMKTGEKPNIDMTEYVREKFPESYDTACIVCDFISKKIKKEITDIEKSYLAIHIERVKGIE